MYCRQFETVVSYIQCCDEINTSWQTEMGLELIYLK
jgi:hypothetical protein